MFFVNSIRSSYAVNNFNSFFFFRDFNKFVFLSLNIKGLRFLSFNLRCFSFGKRFNLHFDNGSVRSLYYGFSLSNFLFFKGSSNKIYFLISAFALRQYKYRLKTLVKTSVNCLSLVKSLNFEVGFWIKEFKDVNFFTEVAFSLDFYVYKLLWKFCKRLHPRRSNSWIFIRYWKQVSGKFKFFYTDPFNGKTFFLLSHVQTIVIKKRIPFTISVFSFYDKSKIYSDWFIKLRESFKGIYGILFDLQRGVCPCCGKLFFQFDLTNLRILHVKNSVVNSNKALNFLLVHRSCFLVIYLKIY